MGSMNVLHTGANVFGNVGACMHRPEGLKAGALQDDARARPLRKVSGTIIC